MKNLINKAKAQLNNNQGFTLVELMVVIVIIAILAAVALPSFMGVMDDAKDSTATSEARSIYMVAEVYANRAQTGLHDVSGVDKIAILSESGIDTSASSFVDTEYVIKISAAAGGSYGNSYDVQVAVLSGSGDWAINDGGTTSIASSVGFSDGISW